MNSLLIKNLKYSLNYYEERKILCNKLLDNPKLLPELINIYKLNENTYSNRAALLIEMACKKNLPIIYPYLDLFSESLKTIKTDGTVRSVAKIAELLALKNQILKDTLLSATHKEKFIEAAFHWLITPQKVAPQAHAMTILYCLGKDQKWIYQELKAILLKKYESGSAGYKARARKVLNQIAALDNSKFK